MTHPKRYAKFLVLPNMDGTASLAATGWILARQTGYQKLFPPYFDFADDFCGFGRINAAHA